MTKEVCVLKSHPEYNGCCCQCKWHIADYSHPNTDGKGASQQRGWVCIGFVMMEGEPVAYSEWPEHGMCELFEGISAQEDNYASL